VADGAIARSNAEAMEELQKELFRWKQELARLRAKGHPVEDIEKRLMDAEVVLTRWQIPDNS
jgi:hypothetical protein